MTAAPAYSIMYIYSTLLTANGHIRLLNMLAGAGAVFSLSHYGVMHLAGMRVDELAAEARKPRHHFGHQWAVGDCVVWDNRATMHRVDVDYPVGERRIMQRVLIEGDRPF